MTNTDQIDEVDVMNKLALNNKLKGREYKLFMAGLPGYSRNFARDSIISLLLTEDFDAMYEQLRFCRDLQGQKADSENGEEAGKIFHEYPGVMINGKNTMYCACDTVGLFLLGLDKVIPLNKELLEEFRSSIISASNYIVSHLDEQGLFNENPSFSGADRYALKVTYWKDSELLNRAGGSPLYPVVFTLAHAVNLAGLRAAARLLETTIFDNHILAMKSGFSRLYNPIIQNFIVAKDRQGEVVVQSDDFLHMLYFLESGDLTDDQLESIVANSKVLETELGYRTNSIEYSSNKDKYHSGTLWPFEQALIYEGAKKFDLKDIMQVASRIDQWLDSEPELYYIDELADPHFVKGGNDPQLWTWAAKQYFAKKLGK